MDHDQSALTVDVRGGLRVDACGGARELETREVARFEDVLTPAASDADRVLAAYQWADAAGDPQGATNLGVLLEQRGDVDGALAAYRRGDARGDVNGSFNLGCLLAEVGDVEGALAALQRADERGDAAGASNLGVLLERQGDIDGALAAYRRADQRGDAYGSFNLALLLAGRDELARPAVGKVDPGRGSADPPSSAFAPDLPEVGQRSRRDWVAAVSILALLGVVALLRRRGGRGFQGGRTPRRRKCW